MPIPLRNLDDRRFADLVQELRSLIPRHAPDWTDHNLSDPGITLIELFAWLTESLLYRVNRVTEASEARFLELLGVRFRSARPAEAELELTATGLSGTLAITKGEKLVARPAEGSPVAFATVQRLELTPAAPSGTVRVRQIERVEEEVLGTSDGRAFQSFRLGRSFVVAAPELEFPPPPSVEVGETAVDGAGEPSVTWETWTYRRNLADLGPEERHKATLSDLEPGADESYTVEARLGAVRFGDHGREDGGGAGRIPPDGSQIRATYWITEGEVGDVPAGTELAFSRDLGVELEVRCAAGAGGGRDPVGLDEARQEALDLLRQRWRAVTAEDFEEIALGDAEIARAKCLPEIDLTANDPRETAVSHVSVVIVPQASGGGPPRPTQAQIARVHAQLDERRLLTCRHHVVGPSYTEVRFTARVVRSPQIDGDKVCDEILIALESFLDPLKGGPEATGWPFGRDVHVSELCQVMEAIEGVDYVDELTLEGREQGTGAWTPPGNRVEVEAENLVSLDLAASVLRLRAGEDGEESECESGGTT